MKRITTDKVQQFELDHAEKVRRGAAECALFLKRNGDFPVSPCSVNLYGSGARRTIKGGKGSGDVNTRYTISIEQGLANAGFTVTTESWLTQYDKLVDQTVAQFWIDLQEEAKRIGTSPYVLVMDRTYPPIEYDMPLSGDGELNVYVIARNQSEGMDRKVIKGDYYLLDSEVRDIKELAARKEKLIVVLNVGAVVDISPIKDVAENILLLGQLGGETGNVFADIITGKSVPSGKLTATWAQNYSDYPSADCFGSKNDTEYKDGVFVGYRYFNSFNIMAQYPFGYGLGYTDFTFIPEDFIVVGNNILATVKVTNTGNYSGKEVMQVYYTNVDDSASPVRQLIAFGKTVMLKSGESEHLKIKINILNAAVYSGKKSAYVLKAGKYFFYVGNSAENVVCSFAVIVEKDIVTEKVTRLHGAKIKEIEKTSKNTEDNPILGIKTIHPAAEQRQKKPLKKPERIAKMTDSELARICVGVLNDMRLDNNIGNSGKLVAGSAGETYSDENTEAITIADGTCGLRISPTYQLDENGRVKASQNALAGLLPGGAVKTESEGELYYQYCTAIPVPVSLAQSWNTKLCDEMGKIIGREMEIFGIDLWLAPAMNIQRSPLCGRNFEYYSEDPYLSGIVAAAVTNGVQSFKGRGVTIKHFCANNQETYRFFNNSVVSERALREIYLKPFKICIEQSNPAAMMSSYNLVNGTHTANSVELLTNVLRGEWGYQGIVMTDWLATGGMGNGEKYPSSTPEGCIIASNDLIMPGSDEDLNGILQAIDEGKITRQMLEDCASRILNLSESKKSL